MQTAEHQMQQRIAQAIVEALGDLTLKEIEHLTDPEDKQFKYLLYLVRESVFRAAGRKTIVASRRSC